jgi:DNA polymerase-3 subunit alpha
MGKKKKKIVDEMKPMFIEGGKKNGHDPKVLEKIWADWEKFASYAFNKSHAACYSWVAFQTAYMKANYPAEFMAAIMSRRRDDIKEITKLMDECRSMGIPTLGPDVNESYLKFGANKKGEIRFGLAAIKGMGDSAAMAIIDEREKNGPYRDIFDFAQRINLTAVNRKAFESLALSGGFDSFGIPRESYFVSDAKGATFLETLVRYGQLYQTEQQQAQNSLFGADDVDIATPAIPKSEPWSNIERLNRERDLVGIYLSAHPLDEYGFILRSMCNTRCSELADKLALVEKKEVVLGGIVTGVRSQFTKNNKPCGFVTIEDFDGQGELAIFDEEWGKWRGMFVEGSIVYVRCKFIRKFPTSTYATLQILDVQYMQTVKDERIERFTIVFDRDAIDDSMVNDIVTMVNDSPGRTELFFNIIDREHKSNLLLRSTTKKIDLKRNLLQYIESNDKLSYHIN